MLPVYIICHANCEPPGYLCTYFDKRNIAYRKISVINNELSSVNLDDLSGLVFMGGPHSVNDNHSWVFEEIELIKAAMENNIPLMGVCFGAQLVSKALGAEVMAASHMETGWHQIEVDTSELTGRHPLNLDKNFEVFEWHEDTFTVPQGAIPLFKGKGVESQGYLFGNVLTMQFHLEMTEHMVHEWLQRYNDCLPDPSHTVQGPQQITQNLSQRLDKLHKLADCIYDWWLEMVYR